METVQISSFRYRVECDRCGRSETSSLTMGTPDCRSPFTDVPAEGGWSVWVGRSRRTYCPDCGPSAGSTMRRVR
jgi:ribosomal protein S27AE